jgi:hypothetical protein
MSFDAYWPVRDEINRCIKAEAESAPDAVLMAVHQPMPLVQREFGSGLETPTTEQALLDAFLSDDLPQGTLLLAITGPSGVGKSHLIRWLAAQLGRDPRASHLHVIRIPKSAKLRRVVELMLAPLAGDPRYAEVRDNLNQAIDAVQPNAAAVRFAGALEIELGSLVETAKAELRNMAPGDSRWPKVSSRAYHAEKLPGLFNDAELREHMIWNVLAPIIQRAVEGREIADPCDPEMVQHDVPVGDDSDQEPPERLPQFRAADLKLSDDLLGALGQAAMAVRNYYRSGLNRADGQGRAEAAAVLNEVVDQAIRQVFGLHQAIGGVTLLDIILRIRELMFQDGRELVLLVEDFAALGGIQQVLLDVCIKEAVYDGTQTLSRMRTALALTDGYLVGRDTIAGRAKYEWLIQSRGNQDDVLGRTIELTGAYLNAARWGESELTRRFQDSARGRDLTGWLEVFDDPDQTADDSKQLTAFGLTTSGIPLFPYNGPALRRLAERHLQEAGELRFNPRRVINFVLRDVLLMRDDFERRAFPPPGFKGADLSAAPNRIASWLNRLALGEEERGRLAALLGYWGGNPQTPEQAGAIAPGLFNAFGLRRPEGLPPPVTPEKPTGPQPEPQNLPTPLPPMAPEDPILGEWDKKLNAWSAGAELLQNDANFLRNAIKGLVEKAVPWNLLRLKKRSLSFLLRIPNARGNDAGAAIYLSIADDHADPTGELRLTLLGAIRLNRVNGRLDYPGADEDSARVATLVERLVSQLLPHLEELRAREVKDLTWVLARQARLLGLVPRERMSRSEALTRAILTPVAGTEPVAPVANEANWQRLRRDAATHRPELLRMLHERIGCFQGDTGRTPFAIDPMLLNIAEETDTPDLNWLAGNQREHCRQLSANRLPTATRPQLETLRKLSARLDALLGSERDKQALVTGLRELTDALQLVGVWPDGYTPQGFRQGITRFGQDSLKAQLDEAGPSLLDANNPPDPAADDTLERLGRIDFTVIDRAGTFLDQVEAFLTGAERAMANKEQGLIGVDPVADAEALAQVLDQIHRDLQTLSGREAP